MRRIALLPLFLGGLLCLAGAAQAQQQESRIQKILHPDTTRQFDLTREKRFGAQSYDGATGKSAPVKAAPAFRKFDGKEFLTGAYHTDKSFWMGDFKYNAGAEAIIKPRSLLLLPESAHAGKAAAVKTAPNTQKTFEAATVPTRDFRGRESERFHRTLTPEQAAANAFEGPLTELKSIDDVRTLLNKIK